MRKNIDYYIGLIENYDPLTAEQHARMDARVRREVIARYGSFALPARVDLSSSPTLNLSGSPALQLSSSLAFKLSSFLAFQLSGFQSFKLSSFKVFLQPAMAFASIAAIAIGVGVFQLATRDDGGRGDGGRAPTISMSEPIARPAVVADVLPGSGIALSVFALSQNTTPTVAPATTITTKKVWRKPKALNPAAGVFTNWGTSVFSKEEIMRQQAKELAVFSG